MPIAPPARCAALQRRRVREPAPHGAEWLPDARAPALAVAEADRALNRITPVARMIFAIDRSADRAPPVFPATCRARPGCRCDEFPPATAGAPPGAVEGSTAARRPKPATGSS